MQERLHLLQDRPIRSWQFDDGCLSSIQVLLVTKVFVGRDEHVEDAVRLLQQVAVREAALARLLNGRDFMPGEQLAQGTWNAFIQQYLHAAASRTR